MKTWHGVSLSLSPSARDLKKLSSKARMRAETQQKLQQTACLGAVHAEIILT